MTSFKRTAAADEDLMDIWRYIAEDNEQAASSFLRELDGVFGMLATLPKAGRARNDLVEGLRYFPVGSYVVLYREMAAGEACTVEVVRVLHGARDVRAVLV